MDILIEKTRRYSRNNQDQRGYLFRTNEKKGKNSNPRMGWFRASGTVEIIYVFWPFITLWSKEGQVDWCIKLQKLCTFEYKDNKQDIFWYNIQKIDFIIHPELFDANNIFSHTFIQNLKHKPNMVQDLSRQMKISL